MVRGCKNKQAIAEHGVPEIVNTDQEAQYTNSEFTKTVLSSEVKLSMDGKGSGTDNAYIERFWRSIQV